MKIYDEGNRLSSRYIDRDQKSDSKREIEMKKGMEGGRKEGSKERHLHKNVPPYKNKVHINTIFS